MDESANSEFAGTAELVTILSMIAKARLTYPENTSLKLLDDAADSVMDKNLFQAVLLQLAAAQEETTRVRQSPAAQIMKARA